MLSPTPTKADEQAVDRMFKRAVQAAITDLRAESASPAPDYAYVTERNVDRFHVAIRASVLFAPQQEVPQQRRPGEGS